MSHQKRRGQLKIYLGYAAGVGKTYQMLEDARELKARGVDVVLAFLEPQGRGDLIERSKEFEMVPLLRVACRGSYIEELDIAGILQRRPKGQGVPIDLAGGTAEEGSKLRFESRALRAVR